jgi:hypothetical protein
MKYLAVWWRSVLPVLVFLVITGCDWTAGASATPEDRQRLERIAQRYRTQLEFTLESDLYMRAKLRPETRVSVAVLEQVYREFFFQPDGTRRETLYVYLNVYDARNRFLFQLYYDPRKQEITRGNAEHY